MAYCKDCIEKDLKIAELQETVKSCNTGKEKEGPFALSTPSSKMPFKETAREEDTNKKGGAAFGHTGHGRASITEETADLVIDRDAGDVCPECGTTLIPVKETNRTILDTTPREMKKILYRLHHKACPCGKKKFTTRAPVLPESLYGNHITARVMHYGIPMGRICEMTGINSGSLIDMFQISFSCNGKLKKSGIGVRHADETGWRNDGQNGYACCTALLSIFLFKNTRSASVPKGIFGEKNLSGVLVVDRYNAYNKLPVKLQYCYAHLLRDLEKLKKDFIDEEEVEAFTGILIPLLSQAQHLHGQHISDDEYYRKAEAINNLAASSEVL